VVDVVLVVLLLVLLVLLVDDELVVDGTSVLVTMLVDVDVELLDELLELVDVVEVVDVVLVVLLVVVGRVPHTTSACDHDRNRSASGSPLRRSFTITCNAVTVMSAVLPATVLDCSLTTIDPIPRGRGRPGSELRSR